MFRAISKLTATLAAGLALSACASDGSFPGSDLTTSSLQQTADAKKPKVDPTCVALSAKINELRSDGITSRVAKAGEGKSKTVSVYRASLSRMAELDRTNAEYQQKCSPIPPASAQQAAVMPAPAPKPQAAKTPATTAVKTVAKKPAAATPTAPAATTQAKADAAADAVKAKAEDAAKTKAAEAASAKAAEVAKAQATDAAKTAATETVAKKVAKEAVSSTPVGQP